MEKISLDSGSRNFLLINHIDCALRWCNICMNLYKSSQKYIWKNSHFKGLVLVKILGFKELKLIKFHVRKEKTPGNFTIARKASTTKSWWWFDCLLLQRISISIHFINTKKELSPTILPETTPTRHSPSILKSCEQ